MDVTVSICTWNRAALLDQLLVSIGSLVVPDGCQWEVLVVNNNCTDATDEVIEKHAATIPIRREFESRQGIAHARNRAGEAAHGNWVLCTDDDTIVDKHWMVEYLRAIEAHPDADLFGGPIAPEFEVDPPAWLQHSFESVAVAYAHLDRGHESFKIDHPMQLPFGANMAIRGRHLKNDPFDVSLGRVKFERIAGEETLMLENLLHAGGHGWWHPEAKVRHFVPAANMTRRFLRKHFFDQGRTHVKMNIAAVHSQAWATALRSELGYRIHQIWRSHRKSASCFVDATIAWGQLWERNLA